MHACICMIGNDYHMQCSKKKTKVIIYIPKSLQENSLQSLKKFFIDSLECFSCMKILKEILSRRQKFQPRRRLKSWQKNETSATAFLKVQPENIQKSFKNFCMGGVLNAHARCSTCIKGKVKVPKIYASAIETRKKYFFPNIQ